VEEISAVRALARRCAQPALTRALRGVTGLERHEP
jgi:hypothetical protein